jgi:formate hydrogenlyase subunit 6/NADH:ubiquinone oxidoreductase subunit I
MSQGTNAKGSIFSTLGDYFRDVYAGIRSVTSSCMTAIPYLFGAGEFRKEVTEQYPDRISSRTADDLPPRTRGLLFNDIEKCTGCNACAEVCPTRCITLEAEPGSEPTKLWVSRFDIDFSRCVFCGLCVDVCAPVSLVHTRRYEAAVTELPDLIAKFGRGGITPEHKEKWAQQRRQKESDGAPI